MPPLGGFPSEYRHPVWYKKNKNGGATRRRKEIYIYNGLDRRVTDGRTSCHGIYAQ